MKNGKILKKTTSLSKSKLLAFRQCDKRLWLEVHAPELREDSASTEASYVTGNEVGAIARQLYDPKGKGQIIDVQAEGFEQALAQSAQLLAANLPVFEAGFRAGGAHAFADIMLPLRKAGRVTWRMVEVKSSTEVKDYHRDDVAVQAFVAKAAGIPVEGVAVAHIDKTWTYGGDHNYSGLLVENDLTKEALSRETEVDTWIRQALKVANQPRPPKIMTGGHCSDPFECGFFEYCRSQEPQAEYPVDWLPQIRSRALKERVAAAGVIDMRHVDDSLLNAQQSIVKTCTIEQRAHFDSAGAARALAPHTLPVCFLDFETINFAIPRWKGTRPYQQIPFQFSAHWLDRKGKLTHEAFLDLSGGDPSKAFAEALVCTCGSSGAVFVYAAAFEKSRISELAIRFPKLRRDLLKLNERIVDLLPVARDYYYHPDQQGSWSIKSVLPAVVPDLSYDQLQGVQNGGMAMEAYREAINPTTLPERKAQIRAQLLDYCRLDTYAMVRLWQFFAGRNDLQLFEFA